MPNMIRRKRHPIFTMASANIDTWLHSPRTVLMIVFAVLLCLLEVRNTTTLLSQNGITLYWSEVSYKFLEYGVNILMSSILVFVMVSELPRQLPYQNYMLIRSNRRQWLTAQILYSLCIVLAIMLLLIICVQLFSIGHVDFKAGWSDTARIAKDETLEYAGAVPKYVREHFSPVTAIFYAALPLFFFWFSLALIILLCSLLGSQFVGLVICAFLLLAHFVGSYPFPYPINFTIVQELNPDIHGPERYRITVAVYIALNAIMILAMYLRVSRTDLVFYAENKL